MSRSLSVSQMNSVCSARKSRRNLLSSRNADVKDTGPILLLPETIFVELISELKSFRKTLKNNVP